MIVAIIAGGSGTRLWPLSTPEYPKHLLSLTGKDSLLQRTYSRSKLLTDKIYVITEKSHSAYVSKQLPSLAAKNIIIEPARRNTASCIMLALQRIKQNEDSDEAIVFLAADHHITDIDGFKLTVQTAAKASEKNAAITLVGIEPRYPATGFGYIHKGTRMKNGYELPVYRVAKFKEKPDQTTAKSYIKSGEYLWNMSLFAAPARVFEDSVKKHSPLLYSHYQKLAATKDVEATYRKFPDLQIDKTIIEKDKNVLVVPGTFGWADIGSFMDLYHVVEQDENGNHQNGTTKVVDAQNNYIHNDLNQPTIVIGLDNIVVVNTKEGLLICRRDQAQKVGEAIKAFKKEQKAK